ncbi:MAG: N-acetylmuramoyl-L-alanine amidase [Endomicrobiia bacterium]
MSKKSFFKIVSIYKYLVINILFLNIFSSFSLTQQLKYNNSLIYAKIIYPSDWISTNSTTTKNNIEKILKNLNQEKYNTIIFSVKRNGFVVYKSSYVEISELFGIKKPNEDFLSFAIEEAKKYNLKFFVVMDLFRANIYAKKSWLCKRKDGSFYEPYFLSCGNLEVQTYLRDIVKEFISLYQVDGIIFENLFYPSKDTSYDDVSLKRFYTRGNPQVLEYENFQREQLNKFISDLYSEIKQKRNDLLIGVIVDSVYKDSFTLEGSFYKNFQDYKNWIENNLCDFIIPKFEPKNFKKIDNFLKIFQTEKVVIGIKENLKKEEFDLIYSKNILGVVNFSTTTLTLQTTPFFPTTGFNNSILSGKVLDEKNLPIEDVWVKLLYPNGKTLQTLTSYDGLFSFVSISTTQPFSLEFHYPYCEKVFISSITLNENEIKVLDPIIINNASSERQKLFFHIINPKDFYTTKSPIHILARTYPTNKVSVFSETISTNPKVFDTGIFVVDNIKLKPEDNIIKFIITDNFNKNISTHFITINYSTKTEVLQTEQETKQKEEFILILPKEDLMLFTNDILELKVKFQSGKNLYALCFDTNEKIFLDEIEPGIYYKSYLIPLNFSSKKTKLKFCYDYKEPKKFFFQKQKVKTKVYPTDINIEVLNSAYPLIAQTIATKTPINYGLHYVRLGGPYITELPKGTKLQIIGKQQNNYKVKLSFSLSGWVEEKNVSFTKENKILQNYFTSCSVLVGDTSEQIFIPWKEQTPFSISTTLENKKTYLLVDFFNTHLATTWIIQNPNSKVVEDIKLAQIEDGYLRMKISIKQNQLWGFWYEASQSNLKIYLKHPPKINNKNPLYGIKIALEAGHGGENNTGAVGLAGTKEKNLNLSFVEILKEYFEKEGAKVILIRQGDTNPSFDERLKIAYDNFADLIISIHANASTTDNGYLSSGSGPSVFYKHEHCKNFAKNIYGGLLDLWNNKGAGLVGNFNYAIVRQSRIPAILIEMGYLTHPLDESILLNRKFLHLQAEKIVNATKKFLIESK